MAKIEFTDNTAKIASMLKDTAIAFLHEAGGELHAEVVRNSNKHKGKGTGQLVGSWKYEVDENDLTATVGSPLENAIWEEFGTGEYAAENNGRKGGWWIKVGYGKNEISPEVAKKYGWEKVRKGKNGELTWVFTRGKKPKYNLTDAYAKMKPKIQKQAERIFKGR